jgi:hypothetical protein
MHWLRAVPLLAFPAILYGVIAVGMDQGSLRAALDQSFFVDTLPSGAIFEVTRGHALTMLAAAMLFIEVVKSTHATTSSIVENGLAFLCFIVAFILFLLHSSFGTIEFALIMTMMLIDFMAGFIVMTISSRRDVGYGV